MRLAHTPTARRLERVALVAVGVCLGVACNIQPQPLPPEDDSYAQPPPALGGGPADAGSVRGDATGSGENNGDGAPMAADGEAGAGSDAALRDGGDVGDGGNPPLSDGGGDGALEGGDGG